MLTDSRRPRRRQPTDLPIWFRRPGDRFFNSTIVLMSSGMILLAVSMAIVLYLEARPTFRAFGVTQFLTETTWDPVALIFGALPFILGTLATSLAATALAVIPGVGVAVYVSEYAPPRIARLINYAVDLLAAIPSVVVGLWAIFNFAPPLREHVFLPIYLWAEVNATWMIPVIGLPSTYNFLTATIILALMIVPYTVALSRDAIEQVPVDQREAAWALGATRWEVMTEAVFPYARTGIVAGVLLSLARSLGETMAVAMLIGNSNRLPITLFGPAATMPSLIINEFREAVDELHYSSIMAVGFYLFVVTLAINLLVSYIQQKISFKKGVL